MKKRTLALILSALTAATVFASCSDSSGGSSAASESSASGSETAGTETGETSGDSDLREEELVTLDIVCMSSGKNEPDITDVENAMNEILEEKLNCNVDLTFIAYANYADQISLLLSSGEDADLLPVYLIPLSTCANAGQIMPLDDLIDQYGPGHQRPAGRLCRLRPD